MSEKWYDKIKKIMRARNIRQVDLMETLGVTTHGAVGHYLSGKRDINPKQLKALCEKFGLSIDDLMGDAAHDPLKDRVNMIIKCVDMAMLSANREYTEEEKLSVYQVAFTIGLNKTLTKKELIDYLKEFLR